SRSHCLETFVVRKGVLTIALAWVAWQPAVAQKSKPENPAAKEVPSNPTTRVVEAVPPAIPPSTDTLAAISRRGRALAVRDSIAWLGAAAMTSLSFPVDSIRRLIVRHSDGRWEVASGTLSDDGAAYRIAEIATPGIQATWASTLFDPPEPDTDYFANAARAIEESIAIFHRPAG